jgi:hypothetical protein
MGISHERVRRYKRQCPYIYYLLYEFDQRLAATVHDIHLSAAAASVVVDTVGHATIAAVDRASVAVEHQGFHPHRVNQLLPLRISRSSTSAQVRSERLNPSHGHVCWCRYVPADELNISVVASCIYTRRLLVGQELFPASPFLHADDAIIIHTG